MSTIPKYILRRGNNGGGGGVTPQNLKTVGFDSLIKDPLYPVSNVEFGYQQQSQSSPGGHLYVGQQMVPMRTINGQPLIGNTDITITGEPNMVSTTYAALKAMRNDNTLVPGTWYRITDYTCTTTQAGTDSAGHDFDIIVRADATGVLNENAFAALHGTDEYFELCNLSAWQLKYCIDNDTNRFSWADTNTGKGVIYFMRDEFGNEAPYDFKNIRFARWAISGISDNNLTEETVESLENAFVYDLNQNPFLYALQSTDYSLGGIGFKIAEKIAPVYYYTYGGDTDQSLDGYNNKCYNNVIKPWIIDDKMKLNNGVYVKTGIDESHHSTFCGNNCYNFTCLSGCDGWNCGNNCYDWLAGLNCYDWKCGNNSYGWVSGNNNHNWVCGNECFYWVCGQGCINWVCENYCTDWRCGDGCSHWHCGNYCYAWVCGNNNKNWDCGERCSFWILDAGITNASAVQYFHLMSGTSGTNVSILDLSDEISINTDYSTYIGFNRQGVLKSWVPADLAP